jgi:hypothetical protein
MGKPSVQGSRRPTLLDQIDFRRFIAARASKWGDEAAKLMWKREQDGRFVIVLVCIAILVASTSHPESLILIVVVGCLAIGLLLTVRILSLTRKIYQAASVSLGIEVHRRSGHAPPRRQSDYEEWCQTNGLTPYSASRRVDP